MSIPTGACQTWNPVTSMPALTTIFTPPEVCSTRFTVNRGEFGNDITLLVQDQFDPVYYSCVPEEWDRTQCQQLSFSPGWCPQGWTEAGVVKASQGTTTATCCMSGYDVKPMPDSYTDFLECTKSTTGVQGTLINVTDSFQIAAEETVRVVTAELNHRGWRVTYDESQRSLFIAAEATGRSGASSNSTSDGAGSAGSNDGSTGGGLSTGAKAGTAIGVVLAVLAFAIGIFMLIRRRKKASATSAVADLPPQYLVGGGAGAKVPEREPKVSELQSAGAERLEMDGADWRRQDHHGPGPLRSPVEMEG